ncbi:MAG: hypothetical protein WKG07_44710 [Hymenobacter sp.]
MRAVRFFGKPLRAGSGAARRHFAAGAGASPRSGASRWGRGRGEMGNG